MEPDDIPPTLPDASGPASTGCPFEASPPRSPFDDPPHSPRLGIIHLMVGTALVACYFSFYRVLMMFETRELTAWIQGLRLTYGLGAGLALGGPVLFVVRRSRGMRFPVHPGETLWILLGIACACGAVSYLVITGLEDVSYSLWRGLDFAQCALFGTIYLVVATRTTIRRWRVFFSVQALCYVFLQLLACAGYFAGQAWMFLFPGAVLVAVVLRDVLRGGRYPWSHWTGVTLCFWFCGVRICSAVYLTFFWQSNL